jgi:hypothetical protein
MTTADQRFYVEEQALDQAMRSCSTGLPRHQVTFHSNLTFSFLERLCEYGSRVLLSLARWQLVKNASAG